MVRMNGKNVLVTGANGFIGRALVERLSADGARVCALVRNEAATLPVAVRPVVVPLEQLTTGHWNRWAVGAFDAVFHLGALFQRRDMKPTTSTPTSCRT